MINFSKESFPKLPVKANYDYQEIDFGPYKLRGRYFRCLKIGIKVGENYRYNIFDIQMSEDNSFPILLDDGTDYLKEYDTIESLQSKIDEIMKSEEVKKSILNIEHAIKSNRIRL